MKVTKIGIVGCGDICTNTYLPNIIDHFKNLEVYALCDINTEHARKLGEKYGISRLMTLDEMCADPNIEIILNTTNPQAHFPVNMQVLKAGKHVYCEKPLGLNVEEARQTMELANEKKLYVGCAPDVFLGAGTQMARKAIDEHLIGDFTGAKLANMGRGPDLFHPRPDYYYKRGGGPMLDIGPYSLSACLYLMGPVEELCCYGGHSIDKRYAPNPTEHMIDVEVNTFYCGIIKFKNGKSAAVNFSWESYCADNGAMVQIYGTHGTLHITDADNYNEKTGVRLLKESDLYNEAGKLTKANTDRAREHFHLLPAAYPSPPENRGLGLSEMADAIIHGRKNLANGEFACHLTEVLDGFNVSIATGKPYKLTTTFEPIPRLPEDFLEYVTNYPAD